MYRTPSETHSPDPRGLFVLFQLSLCLSSSLYSPPSCRERDLCLRTSWLMVDSVHQVSLRCHQFFVELEVEHPRKLLHAKLGQLWATTPELLVNAISPAVISPHTLNKTLIGVPVEHGLLPHSLKSGYAIIFNPLSSRGLNPTTAVLIVRTSGEHRTCVMVFLAPRVEQRDLACHIPVSVRGGSRIDFLSTWLIELRLCCALLSDQRCEIRKGFKIEENLPGRVGDNV